MISKHGSSQIRFDFLSNSTSCTQFVLNSEKRGVTQKLMRYSIPYTQIDTISNSISPINLSLHFQHAISHSTFSPP